MTEVNNFNKLISVINKVGDREKYEAKYTDILTQRTGQLIRRILATAPEGQEEPDMEFVNRQGVSKVVSHGRPSLRQHGKTLADSIEKLPKITKTQAGVRAAVIVDHPTHGLGKPGLVDWLSKGTIGHTIPELDVLLLFWWGAPLRWPAKDGKPAGPRFAGFVPHPGIAPSSWPRAAIKETVDEIRPELAETTQKLLFDPLRQAKFMEKR